ncbi:MAG: hypothetical protein WDM89_00565 [Rhizomicrobium sp.]
MARGARRLEAEFYRADGQVRRIAVETGSPVREPKIVERLFREKLDALIDPLDPGFGFDLIRLSATHTERGEIIDADFDADLNAQREIRFLIDRLAARFGSQRISLSSRTIRTSPNSPSPQCRRNTREAQKSPGKKSVPRKKPRDGHCAWSPSRSR